MASAAITTDLIASFATEYKKDKKRTIKLSSNEMSILALKMIPFFKRPNGKEELLKAIEDAHANNHKGALVYRNLGSELYKFASKNVDGVAIRGSATNASPQTGYLWADQGNVKIGLDEWESEKFIEFDTLWFSNEFATTLKMFFDKVYNGNYYIARKRKVLLNRDVTYAISVDLFGDQSDDQSDDE